MGWYTRKREGRQGGGKRKKDEGPKEEGQLFRCWGKMTRKIRKTYSSGLGSERSFYKGAGKLPRAPCTGSDKGSGGEKLLGLERSAMEDEE